MTDPVLRAAAVPTAGGVREGAPGKHGARDTLTGVFSVWSPMMTTGIRPSEKQCQIRTILTMELVGFLDISLVSPSSLFYCFCVMKLIFLNSQSHRKESHLIFDFHQEIVNPNPPRKTDTEDAGYAGPVLPGALCRPRFLTRPWWTPQLVPFNHLDKILRTKFKRFRTAPFILCVTLFPCTSLTAMSAKMNED